MKLTLPKLYRGQKYDELFVIEMNNFDIDMLLPSFFWTILSKGKKRAKIKEKRNPQSSINELAKHEKLEGFLGNDNGQRVLAKWVKTSVVKATRAGKAHKGSEVINYVRPLSLLAFKGPSPEGGFLRGTHQFLYDLLFRYGLQEKKDQDIFLNLVRKAFGRGLVMETGAVKDGKYDGSTDLDLEVLLSMYFLDGLEGVKETISSSTSKKEIIPVCPTASKVFVEDITTFISCYRMVLTPAALSRHLATLLNFEFLIYTLNLFRGVNSLVLGDPCPELLNEEVKSRLEVYVNMTQSRTDRSAMMARGCINRDLETAELYLRHNFLLRFLDQSISLLRDYSLEDKRGSERIKFINNIKSDNSIESVALAHLSALRNHFSEGLDDDEDFPPELSEIFTSNRSAVDRVTDILYLCQRKAATGSLMKWIQSTGGLRRTDGILEGNIKGRRNWRYSLSDPLLEVLCMLAVVHPKIAQQNGEPNYSGKSKSILLSSFLEFLKERYGILIAEPPSHEEGAEATAAAKENLAALRRRLRQIGLFQDLSDDFNAQRIEPRYKINTTNENS